MDDFWQSIDDNAFNLPPSHVSPHISSSAQQPQLAPPHPPPPPQPQPEPMIETLLAEGSSTPAGPGDDLLLAGSITGETNAVPPDVTVGSGVIDQAPATSGGDEVTERDKVLCLLSHFDHDQLERYEAFRRGAFSKSVIRMIMQTVSGRPVTQNAVIAMAGITKVYVGEIVEEALRFREQQLAQKDQPGEGGEATKEPLKPSHVYEAVRRLSDKIIQKRPPEFRL